MLRFAVQPRSWLAQPPLGRIPSRKRRRFAARATAGKGIPEDQSTPIIWGQNAGYLYLQFRDFQKGARKDDRMTPIAQCVVKEDALALAEYFAAKPWPKTGAPSATKADKDAAMVAINSVVCTSCHLEQFQGDSSVPRLAGQNAITSPRR